MSYCLFSPHSFFYLTIYPGYFIVALIDNIPQNFFFKLWQNIHVALAVKKPPDNAGDVGSILGSGRSPGGGHGFPIQFSCLENPVDRGVWKVMVHRVAKS